MPAGCNVLAERNPPGVAGQPVYWVAVGFCSSVVVVLCVV